MCPNWWGSGRNLAWSCRFMGLGWMAKEIGGKNLDASEWGRVGLKVWLGSFQGLWCWAVGFWMSCKVSPICILRNWLANVGNSHSMLVKWGTLRFSLVQLKADGLRLPAVDTIVSLFIQIVVQRIWWIVCEPKYWLVGTSQDVKIVVAQIYGKEHYFALVLCWQSLCICVPTLWLWFIDLFS